MRRTRAERAARALGARRPLGTIELMIFVPSVDRSGRRLWSAVWTGRTLEILGRLFRGATAYPRGRGVWRDDAAEGRLVFDETTIVFSYVNPADWTRKSLLALREFLHRMGRQAQQGEVGLVVDGEYVGIIDFEESPP